jgi:hypothetical protein
MVHFEVAVTKLRWCRFAVQRCDVAVCVSGKKAAKDMSKLSLRKQHPRHKYYHP